MRDTESRFAFRLDKALHKDLKRKALEEEVSLAEVTRALLRLWLEDKVQVPTSMAEGEQPPKSE